MRRHTVLASAVLTLVVASGMSAQHDGATYSEALDQLRQQPIANGPAGFSSLMLKFSQTRAKGPSPRIP